MNTTTQKPLSEIEDYKEAALVLKAEFDALNWHNVKAHGGHIATDDSGWKHYSWQVEYAPPSKSPVLFDWKAGIAHKNKLGRPISPNPAEVLGRVCADYLSAVNETFPDWSANFGYDEDSRKAHRIYEECQALGNKLKALGLTRAQIERFGALAEML